MRRAQIDTVLLVLAFFCCVMFLVHFDAVRVRFLRRAHWQLSLGLLAIANCVRVLVRERFNGRAGCIDVRPGPLGLCCRLTADMPRAQTICSRRTRFVSRTARATGHWWGGTLACIHEQRIPTDADVQAMSSLINLTIFFLKFLVTRIRRRPTLCRLPVVARKLAAPSRIELLAVVPPQLMPAGTRLKRLLDRLETANEQAVLSFRAVLGAGAGPSAADKSSLALQLGEREASMDHFRSPPLGASPSGADASSSPLTVSGSARELEPSLAPSPGLGDRASGGDPEALDARGDRGSEKPPAQAQRTRASITLTETQPDALANSVLVPIAMWPTRPLVSVPVLVRARRSVFYQIVSKVVAALITSGAIWAVWSEYNSLWLFVCTGTAITVKTVVELTRWERGLLAALVRACRTVSNARTPLIPVPACS
jgi:hypothetical protein